MEIEEQSGKRYAFRVKNCLFYEFFSSIGAPELTRFMCATDNAIFSSYLPDEVTFHRNGRYNTIADGAPECRFILENKEDERS
jgi:predicted ArsR family transcriptional regulator